MGVRFGFYRFLKQMDQSEKAAGTGTALMIRMKETRFPWAKRLLDKVTGGKLLSNADSRFLERVDGDYRANQALMKRDSEYFQIMSGFIGLYTEIIIRGLENEQVR